MDSKLYIEKAENEIKLAEIIFVVSDDISLQKSVFKVYSPETYFSGVITHSYYSIFYAAKAYLCFKGVFVKAPEEHRKALDAFSQFVQNGELDVELLTIYHEAVVHADVLLGIFGDEKQKRGDFTYRTLPQANKEPAEESIARAKFFYKNIFAILPLK